MVALTLVPDLLAVVAETKLDELDTVSVAHVQRSGEIGGGVPVAGARHAEVGLRKEDEVQIVRSQELGRGFAVFQALGVPGCEAQRTARRAECLRRAVLDSGEGGDASRNA